MSPQSLRLHPVTSVRTSPCAEQVRCLELFVSAMVVTTVRLKSGRSMVIFYFIVQCDTVSQQAVITLHILG